MTAWWGYLLSLVVRLVGIKSIEHTDVWIDDAGFIRTDKPVSEAEAEAIRRAFLAKCPVCGLTDGWHEVRL